jgi:hypothetical protein
MKKCPQCEFIYEDDQSLCDMDGVLLVFDSRTLPNLHALATVPAPVPGRASRRNRVVPAFATLILMLAVGSVYYVSTTRSAAPPNFQPASVTTSTAEATTPPPVEEPVAVPAPSAEPEPKKETQPAATQPKPASPAPTKTATKTPNTKAEPKKDDSKVESILKKTGKILKKPFKF